MLLCFALLEGISLMMGLGISDFLSDLLGLPDGGDVPSDVPDGPGAETSIAGPLLSWLEIGKLPVLVSFCLFLAATISFTCCTFDAENKTVTISLIHPEMLANYAILDHSAVSVGVGR